jgi:GAF domain-containing protein
MPMPFDDTAGRPGPRPGSVPDDLSASAVTGALERDLARNCLSLIDALASLRLLLGIPRDLKAHDLLGQSLRALLHSHAVARCSVFLLRAGLLSFAAAAGIDDAAADLRDETGPIRLPRSFRLGEGIMGLAALERRTLAVADVRREPRYIALPSCPRPPRALVSVPLLAGPRLLGVLNVSHPDPHHWGHWQRQVFELHALVIAERLDAASGEQSAPIRRRARGAGRRG